MAHVAFQRDDFSNRISKQMKKKKSAKVRIWIVVVLSARNKSFQPTVTDYLR